MSGPFQDHFGSVAAHYAESRPSYPPALFTWLAGLCPSHELAWDCGAGSGQASLGLAEHFERVVATDASAGQISRAAGHPRIEYRVADAGSSGLAPGSVDLAVVAQALHWFDLEAFYAEVRRVLRPAGVLAVWTYGIPVVDDPDVNALVQRFYHDEVSAYWPPERHHVETGYRELPFPFESVDGPAFSMVARWDIQRLLGYFRSWSATARYIQARGRDPVEELEPVLRSQWGDGERLVSWPLSVRAGRLVSD